MAGCHGATPKAEKYGPKTPHLGPTLLLDQSHLDSWGTNQESSRVLGGAWEGGSGHEPRLKSRNQESAQPCPTINVWLNNMVSTCNPPPPLPNQDAIIPCYSQAEWSSSMWFEKSPWLIAKSSISSERQNRGARWKSVQVFPRTSPWQDWIACCCGKWGLSEVHS